MGCYISQDPIGLSGNNPTLYGYVETTNVQIDLFGLNYSKTNKNSSIIPNLGSSTDCKTINKNISHQIKI